MGVGTWGYGTGALTADAHPFSLRIQGVDYIGSVPIDSITVNASVSSNATMTFTIIDQDGTLPIPQGWADVEFVDNGVSSSTVTGTFQDELTQDDAFDEGEAVEVASAEWVFGGLVMGTTVRADAASLRYIDVRCVDYGILLDVAPLMSAITIGPGVNTNQLHYVMQAIAGAAPLGGIMALPYTTGGAGRVAARINEGTPGELYSLPIAVGTSEAVDLGTLARSALEQYADINEDPYAVAPRPADVYVTALKQLAVRPSGKTWGNGSIAIDVAPVGVTETTAADIASDTDWRPYESGVYVEDGERIDEGTFYQYSPIDSGWYAGTINGYTVMPGRIVVPLPDASQLATEGRIYLDRHGEMVTGTCSVIGENNFTVGMSLQVYYPSIDLDATYAIHAVSYRFLGGSQRRCDIQFGGELGSLARFNRTRFARAGVTT